MFSILACEQSVDICDHTPLSRMLFFFFFFKQKTAYEMRISDWSSDVCSSDLRYGTGRKVSGADAATSYRAMEADMAAAVAVFEARHRVRETVARGPVQMLGTSGTVTTLAGVHKELRRYDRAAVDGSYLDMAIVRSISERIGAMSQDRKSTR